MMYDVQFHHDMRPELNSRDGAYNQNTNPQKPISFFREKLAKYEHL
jgi:hypothetical protein